MADRSDRDGSDARGPSGRAAEKGGEVILIPKQLRMEWTDALALDNGLGHVAFRVACVIGHHLNRHRGDTYVTQETIARLTGISARAVRNAIAELEARGYLIVERRELGARADGRRVCGGRGVANTYRPACDRSPVTATAGGRRLVERAEALKAERRNGDSSIPAAKEEPACLHSGGERRNGEDGKEEPGFLPTLASPSGKNPTRARGGGPAGGSGAGLGAAGERLRRRIGAPAFHSWFGEVEILGRAGGVVTLAARTAFAADWIVQHYGGALLAAFRAADPGVERVEIVSRDPPDTG